MLENQQNTNIRLKAARLALGVNSGEFAKKADIDPRNYSSIETGKRAVGERVLRDICSAFPINLNWLLTGHGEMLKNSESTAAVATINYERKGVPYYDVDFIGGFDLVLNDQTVNPEYYVNFKQYNGADFWVNVNGHSMEPEVAHGDMIAIKELRDWHTHLLYGEMYALVTDENRTVKYVRKSIKGEEWLRLVPVNTNEYDEQDIPKSVIVKVFKVLGCTKRIQ